ncbi:hypothetical protein IJG29_00715 [Candidatus Saccharibacteria bacterium]|nr:hypothetical protein [Candidatus Saccharibacteria bacterium]
MKKVVTRFVVLMMAFLCGGVHLVPGALALTEEEYKIYAENNIYFYDPLFRYGGGGNFCANGGDCYITGDTKEEKLWSALRHVGFTPEQAAAIMGNIVNEGSTPTRQEDAYNIARTRGCLTMEGKEYDIWLDNTDGAHHAACMNNIYSQYHVGRGVTGIGLGFIQWSSHGRRINFLDRMSEAGLLKYFEGDAYKTYGKYSDEQLRQAIIDETGKEDDYWALWCVSIKMIYDELNSVTYKSFYDQTTVASMAGNAAQRYEGCAGCRPGEASYNKRVQDAEHFYEMYTNGDFDAVEQSLGGAAAGSNKVTIGAKSTCAIPNNVTAVEDALKLVNQFIADTNFLYDTNYPYVEFAEMNVLLPTPRDDSFVRARASVVDGWVSDGTIKTNARTSGCWGGTYCGQCTAFSGWFTTMMTDYIYNGGNGVDVVSNLGRANDEIVITNYPTPFSVFSQLSGSAAGHTGVVVGDFGDGTFLTIENNMGPQGSTKHSVEIRRRTLDDFTSRNATFAVMQDKLKINHLGTRYGV